MNLYIYSQKKTQNKIYGVCVWSQLSVSAKPFGPKGGAEADYELPGRFGAAGRIGDVIYKYFPFIFNGPWKWSLRLNNQ